MLFSSWWSQPDIYDYCMFLFCSLHNICLMSKFFRTLKISFFFHLGLTNLDAFYSDKIILSHKCQHIQYHFCCSILALLPLTPVGRQVNLSFIALCHNDLIMLSVNLLVANNNKHVMLIFVNSTNGMIAVFKLST